MAPGAGNVRAGADLGSVGSAGSAGSVGSPGGASIGSDVQGGRLAGAGGANVSGSLDVSAGAGGSSDVQRDLGKASSIGATSSSPGGGAGLDVNAGAGATRDVERGATDAQHAGRSMHVEAAVNRELGADARSAVRGGTGEQHVMAGARQVDVGTQARGELDVEARASARATDAVREGAVEGSGYRDPESELGRAERGEFHARDQQMGRVRQAEATSREARGVANDPTGAASTAVSNAGMQEVNERAPVSAADVKADVNVASQTVRDPSAAGQARVDVAVDAEVREHTSGLPKPDKK
jgi:hypothetical protein